MRNLLAILCGVIVLASLFGEVRLNHFLAKSIPLEAHAMPANPEPQCNEGFGHGACQTLLSCQNALPVPWLDFATSQFELVPVRASSRIYSPQLPPPRGVS